MRLKALNSLKNAYINTQTNGLTANTGLFAPNHMLTPIDSEIGMAS